MLYLDSKVAFKRFGKHFDESTAASSVFFLPLYLVAYNGAVASHALGWATTGPGSEVALFWSLTPALVGTAAGNHAVRLLMCAFSPLSSSLLTMPHPRRLATSNSPLTTFFVAGGGFGAHVFSSRCKLTASSTQGSLCAMFAVSTYRFIAILAVAALDDGGGVGGGGGDGSRQRGMWAGAALVAIGTAFSLSSEAASRGGYRVLCVS